MEPTLEIRQMLLEDLRPAPYNPRHLPQPGEPAYEKLTASLREFGLVEPLIWNETTGHIVGGHLRLTILRSLGVERVPVSVVRLEPVREKALNIVLNNREAQGKFDTGKLADLLAELEDLPEFAMTGFDSSQLQSLRLKPADQPVSEDHETGEVEITLTLPKERYDAFAPHLDALVTEFDLRCHVRC